MAREKIKHHHDPGVRIWKEPTEYKLPEDARKDWKRKGLEERYEYLRQIPAGNYLVIDYLPAREQNTRPFFEDIKQLEELGLEIRKDEEAIFGFKMPLAEKGERERPLIIFKRR